MSDELIKSLNQRISEQDRRISELEQGKAQLTLALRNSEKAEKRAKVELKTLQEEGSEEANEARKQLEDLLAKADEEFAGFDAEKQTLTEQIAALQSKIDAAPSEKDAKIAELETSLRTRDFRDSFKEAINGELNPEWTVDDVWHFGQFDPKAVEKLEPTQINELIGKVKEAKPGMFAKPVAAPGHDAASQRGPVKPPLKVDEPPSRGARDSATGRVKYSKADLRQPGWQSSNPSLHEAIRNGTAVCTDAE